MSWQPLLPFAVFFLVLMVFCMRSRVPCPDCGKLLSPLQSPITKTRRQWIEGGYLCKHCGCESDVSGDKVVAGGVSRSRSIYLMFGLVALAAVPAVAMLVVLLRP